MVVAPGGLPKESWPVTVRMAPLPAGWHGLIGPAEVVLQHPERHVDFLFSDTQQGE